MRNGRWPCKETGAKRKGQTKGMCFYGKGAGIESTGMWGIGRRISRWTPRTRGCKRLVDRTTIYNAIQQIGGEQVTSLEWIGGEQNSKSVDLKNAELKSGRL